MSGDTTPRRPQRSTGATEVAASLTLLPPESSPRRAALMDASFALGQAASGLGSALHPYVRAAVGDLVRAMNCYYSNLIEGHHTLPVEIDQALNASFSEVPEKRDLQREAVAHIEVQRLIDTGALDGLGLGADLVRRLHLEFGTRLPADLLLVTDPETGRRHDVVPGAWRTEHVKVGRHVALAPEVLPGFMAHFSAGYAAPRVGRATAIMAAAAAHHRLLWIHPFLDGNGRVARLHSHAYLRHWGVGSELWSVSRGLARTTARYKELLARADAPPQGAADGRGTLSDGRLADFIAYFIEVCLDQVAYMADLLRPHEFLDRLHTFVLVEGRRKPVGLDPRVRAVLERAFIAGAVEKSALEGLLGVGSYRQAARLVEPLVRRGLLVSAGHHAPYRLAFPLGESELLFPRLFAPPAA